MVLESGTTSCLCGGEIVFREMDRPFIIAKMSGNHIQSIGPTYRAGSFPDGGTASAPHFARRGWIAGPGILLRAWWAFRLVGSFGRRFGDSPRHSTTAPPIPTMHEPRGFCFIGSRIVGCWIHRCVGQPAQDAHRLPAAFAISHLHFPAPQTRIHPTITP